MKKRDISAIRAKIGGDLEELNELERESTVGRGSFAWVDSDLVEAIIAGHWILLDNASLASDALLDRLNSLLEPGNINPQRAGKRKW